MQESNDSGVSRRDVLEQTGAAATALAGVGTAPAVAALGERKTTIVTLAQRDEARGTERVSKRWLQQTKRATRVKEQLMNAHGNSEGVRSIGITSADRTIGGLRAEAVSVGVTDSAHAQSIPSSVDGVPVVTEVTGRSEPTGCVDGYCPINPDRIKGGIDFQTPYRNGSIGCRVVYNGNYHMLTARHSFVKRTEEGYCKGSMDVSTWQRDGTTLGPVAADFQQKDAALLRFNDQNSDTGYSNKMVDESGEVVGRVTESGLKYLNGNTGETVHKRGKSTGAQSGYIKKIQQYIYCDSKFSPLEGVVRSTPDQEQGDSGGVVYFKQPQSSSPDHLYVVNIASIKELDGTDDNKGSSANVMYNDHGIWFGGESYQG